MKICITNKLGRPYIISYVVNEDKATFTRYLLLDRGVNIVASDLFEKLKNHPLVKHYIENKIFVITDAISNSQDNKTKDNVGPESQVNKNKDKDKGKNK